MKQGKRMMVLAMVAALLLAWVPYGVCQDPGKININKATVEELMQLEKIGKKGAEKIVAYRLDNGPFETPEDIMKVKGVGSRTFELNQERISVE